jgi:hypothetical protein
MKLEISRQIFEKFLNCQGTRGSTVSWGTSQKVAGSIPNYVNRIFHWHNPSGRIMTLGSTQPLTEMSTRNIFWGVKSAGSCSWQPYHLHVPIVLKSGSLNILESSGPVQTCNGIILLYHSYQVSWKICVVRAEFSCGQTDRHDKDLVVLKLTVICLFRLKNSWWQQSPFHPGTKLTFRHPSDPTAVTVSPIAFPLLNTTIIFGCKCFKDIYLLNQYTNWCTHIYIRFTLKH